MQRSLAVQARSKPHSNIGFILNNDVCESANPVVLLWCEIEDIYHTEAKQNC